MRQLLLIQWGTSSEFLSWNFQSKVPKKFCSVTFSRQKDETLKMLYRRLFKLKEDTQSITDLETTHWYIRSLESTPTLHAQVL
jgi:hypothetical protein